MANKFIKYLTQGAVGGFLTPKGLMGNWQHASRVFVDDTFRLSPRTKFLFYVHFELDKTAMNSPAFTNRHADEMGVLVKAADLPKFNFDSVVKNQYNRKKILYKQINYEPVNITFHDDTQGIINALWAIYYGSYIQDRHNPVAAFSATHYRSSNDPLSAMRYGLDRNKSTDIFKSISIYTMSRSRFNGYTLVNPRIKTWQHGNVDYSAAETLESTMTLEYETVFYTQGKVSKGTPKGFATLHYDSTPSPLTLGGGSSFTAVSGTGGVRTGAEQIFGTKTSGTTPETTFSMTGKTLTTIDNYNNTKSLNNNSTTNPAVKVSFTTPSTVGQGSLNNISFPVNNSNNAPTKGILRNVTGSP
jgi:hypothetical protein